MRHPLEHFRKLKRPGLLVSAARCAQESYQRDITLRAALRGYHDGPHPGPAEALILLLQVEERLEEMRRTHDAAWSAARHVAVLSALMAEAQALQAGPAVTAVPGSAAISCAAG